MIANAMRESEINPLAFNSIDNRSDQHKEKGVYFSEYEWNVFTEELKLGRSVETALHNARYYGELKRRIDNLEAGRNTVTFTDEEWEKMLSEQDI